MARSKRKPVRREHRSKPTKRRRGGFIAPSKKVSWFILGALACLIAVNMVGMLELLDEDDQPYSRLSRQPSAEVKEKAATAKKAAANPLKEVDPAAVLDGSWSKGMASGYDLQNNDGWDETASGIPLDNETYTVAVPQEEAHRLLSMMEIMYEGTLLTAQVTDTGGFTQYGRDLDLGPAVWRAFGADDDDEWGVREVHYRYI